MDKPSKQPHAHLFTVRAWLEDLGDGQREWRGSVKNVASGEQRAFRQWTALAQVMQALLPAPPSASLRNDEAPEVALAGVFMDEVDG